MDAQPQMVVPLEVATELRALRAELAALRKVVAPLVEDANWLSIEAAAAKYDVTASTVNRWVKSGRMRAKGAGASRRVQMA